MVGRKMKLFIKWGVSNMREKVKMVILISFIVLFLGVCVYIGFAIHWFNNTEVEMYSVTHLELSVSEEDVIDYNVFLNPQKDKTRVLEQINEINRIQIADYMKKNNFKLKKGDYYIPKKSIIDGKENAISYDEYIECFDFEKIK